MCINGSRRALCMCLGLALFSAAAIADDKVTIRRAFHPGKKVYVERRDKIDIAQKMPGMDTPMNIKMSAIKGVWEVAESDPSGGTKVVMTFDRAGQEMAMAHMDRVVYDTDDPDFIDAAPMLQTIFDNMVGESMTMVVDPKGNVTSLTGMDEINAKISEKAVANMFWMQMSREMNNVHAASEWGEGPMMYYPNRDVEVGESWQSSLTSDLPQMGKIVTTLDLKLEEVKDVAGRKIAMVAYNGTVKSVEEGSATQINGTMAGTAMYDVENGVYSKDHQKGQWNIQTPSPMGGDGKMEMVIQIDSLRNVLSEAERAAQRKTEAAERAARRKAEAAAEADED